MKCVKLLFEVVFLSLLLLAVLGEGRVCDVTVAAAGGGGDDTALLEAALAEATAIRRAQQTPAPVVVCLQGAAYRLARSLVVGPNASGTAAAPLVITSADSQRLTALRGAVAVPRMAPATDPALAARGVLQCTWSANASAAPATAFASLFVRGVRRTPARFPNANGSGDGGWLTLFAEADCDDDSTSAGYFTFRFDNSTEDGQRFGAIADLSNGGRVVNPIRWEQPIAEIASVSSENSTVRTQRRSSRKWGCGYSQGVPFYVENVLSQLDSPGEFFYDPSGPSLFYLPMQGETSETLDGSMEIALLETVVSVEGASHVIFERIALGNSAWNCPTDGTSRCDGQSAAFQWTGAVVFQNADHCEIAECVVSGTGFYAVYIDRSTFISVVRSRFDDLGSGAFRQADTTCVTHNLTFADNVVSRYGVVFRPATALFVQRATDVELVHNEVSDGFYSAVGIGWSWGFATTCTGNINVAYNHLHHIGKRVMSDLAAVYSLGIQPGTRVSNNVVHDVSEMQYGGWGLYADEGSTFIEYRGNVVFGTDSGSWFVHYGSNLTIKENLFWNSISGAIRAADRWENRPLLNVACNILVSQRPGDPFYFGNTVFALNNSINSFDLQAFLAASNLTTDDVRPNPWWSFEDWMARGFDQHSTLKLLEALADDAASPELKACHNPRRCNVKALVSAVSGLVSGCDYSPILETLRTFGPRSFAAASLVLHDGHAPTGESENSALRATASRTLLPGGWTLSTAIPANDVVGRNDTVTFDELILGSFWDGSSLFSFSPSANNFATISNEHFVAPHTKSLRVRDYSNNTYAWQPLISRGFTPAITASVVSFAFDVFPDTLDQNIHFETRTNSVRSSPAYEVGISLDIIKINETHVRVSGGPEALFFPAGWLRFFAMEENTGKLGWGEEHNTTHKVLICALDAATGGCVSQPAGFSQPARSKYFCQTNWVGFYVTTSIEGDYFLDTVSCAMSPLPWESASASLSFTDTSDDSLKVVLFRDDDALDAALNNNGSGMALLMMMASSGKDIAPVRVTVGCGATTHPIEFVELVRVHTQPEDAALPELRYDSSENLVSGNILSAAAVASSSTSILTFDAAALGPGTHVLASRCLFSGMPLVGYSAKNITLVVELEPEPLNPSSSATASSFSEHDGSAGSANTPLAVQGALLIVLVASVFK